MMITHEWLWDYLRHSFDVYEVNLALHTHSDFIPEDLEDQIEAMLGRAGRAIRDNLPAKPVNIDAAQITDSPVVLVENLGTYNIPSEREIALGLLNSQYYRQPIYLERLDAGRLIFNSRNKLMIYDHRRRKLQKLFDIQPSNEFLTFLTVGSYQDERLVTTTLNGLVCATYVIETSELVPHDSCIRILPVDNQSLLRIDAHNNFALGNDFHRFVSLPYELSGTNLRIFNGSLFSVSDVGADLFINRLDPHSGRKQVVAEFKSFSHGKLLDYEVNIGYLTYVVPAGIARVDLFSGQHEQYSIPSHIQPKAVSLIKANRIMFLGHDTATNQLGLYELKVQQIK